MRRLNGYKGAACRPFCAALQRETDRGSGAYALHANGAPARFHSHNDATAFVHEVQYKLDVSHASMPVFHTHPLVLLHSVSVGCVHAEFALQFLHHMLISVLYSKFV